MNPYSDFPPRRRYEYGWLAWQATLGYISVHHSPDTILVLEARPRSSSEIMWSAAASWGQIQESVNNQASLAAALSILWQVIEAHHTIFFKPGDIYRRPLGYEDHEWLDVSTQESIQRILWTNHTVFENDWSLVIVYQPTEIAHMRVQMRLLAKGHRVRVGARGSSVLDAARDLYRNAAPAYLDYSALVNGDLPADSTLSGQMPSES